MKNGTKAQGQCPWAKRVVIRHGRGSRRGCNAAEKAAVRQAWKKACREAL
jgi:hypothetical protein